VKKFNLSGGGCMQGCLSRFYVAFRLRSPDLAMIWKSGETVFHKFLRQENLFGFVTDVDSKFYNYTYCLV
jgi:hypothetical protein